MSLHLLIRIHPHHGHQHFLPSGYINPQRARILRTSGSEIGSADSRVKQ